MSKAIQGWFGGAGDERLWASVDLLLAFGLSVFAVMLTAGVLHTGHPHGGVWASIAVLALTVPVARRRRAPLGAAAMIAAGALVSALMAGTMVRCGAALPALFLIVFSVGARLGRRRALIGLALGLVAMVALACSDPALGSGACGPGAVIVTAMWAVGRVVQSRERLVARLRDRTRELDEQRKRTAELAVASERARVIAGLDETLRERISKLAMQADSGAATIDADPEAARAALAGIGDGSREALAQMREMVGSLREPALDGPAPVLADLDQLVARASGPRARLRVEGQRRTLAAGLELTGYRIVEHLVQAIADVPAGTLEVRLQYGEDHLDIDVSGSAPAARELQSPLATARQWASLHGGRIDVDAEAGWLRARVRLPLISAYA